jgi:hypothetical protein
MQIRPAIVAAPPGPDQFSGDQAVTWQPKIVEPAVRFNASADLYISAV